MVKVTPIGKVDAVVKLCITAAAGGVDEKMPVTERKMGKTPQKRRWAGCSVLRGTAKMPPLRVDPGPMNGLARRDS